MPNFYYIDASGQKQGSFTPQQLKVLAMQGVINPQTLMESDTGHQGQAGQIPGLFAVPQPPPKPVIDENTFTAFVQDAMVQKEVDQAPPYRSYEAPRTYPKSKSTFLVIVGIVAFCYGVFFAVITIVTFADNVNSGNEYTSDMQQASNNTYGSYSTPNDVETNKSKYMFAFARFINDFSQTHKLSQFHQRLHLSVIIICIGSFLVVYGSRYH